MRQPVHVFYGGAHLFRPDIIDQAEPLVLAALDLLSLLRELEIEATHINTLQHAENEIGPFLWSELYETCARARALIAKAEGREA